MSVTWIPAHPTAEAVRNAAERTVTQSGKQGGVLIGETSNVPGMEWALTNGKAPMLDVPLGSCALSIVVLNGVVIYSLVDRGSGTQHLADYFPFTTEKQVLEGLQRPFKMLAALG